MQGNIWIGVAHVLAWLFEAVAVGAVIALAANMIRDAAHHLRSPHHA